MSARTEVIRRFWPMSPADEGWPDFIRFEMGASASILDRGYVAPRRNPDNADKVDAEVVAVEVLRGWPETTVRFTPGTGVVTVPEGVAP